MADINFIEDYVPAYVELEQTRLYETRERLVNFLRTKFDDVDLVPNTVVGDLIVSPQTYTLAALEEGLNRLQSDLSFSNLAQGIVYNCNFATNWLSNFITAEHLNLKASGVIRLTFTQNKPVVLHRGVQFTFNGTKIFTMYLPHLGAFTIYPVGQTVPDNTNGATLIDTGSGSYICDIPVIGESGTLVTANTDVITLDSNGNSVFQTSSVDADTNAISAGTECELNVVLENLDTATALIDFDPGYMSMTISEAAKFAQKAIYAASLNTRTGAMRFTELLCPFTESVYAICSGDKEMLRTYHNPYGVSTGCMDLYVRSKGYEFTETQTLRLYLTEDSSAYAGEWYYTGQPYHIESITHADLPNVLDIPNVTITSTNSAGFGAAAAYTSYEKLNVSIPNLLNELGDSIYSTHIDTAGRVYTEFTIVYQTDPTQKAIEQTIYDPDNMAINTSILVRGFIPVIIDKFEIVYTRTPGIVPTLNTAADEIKSYIGGLGAPNVFSEAEIARIMGEAGAKYTKGINVLARVQWSVANKIMDYSGNIVAVPTFPSIMSSEGLRIQYPAESVQLTANDMFACSVRNVRYYLMENSVTFKEVKDI